MAQTDLVFDYPCVRDNCADSAGDGAPSWDEWHANEGAGWYARIAFSDHQWHGDWDTEAMKSRLGGTPYDVTYEFWVHFAGNEAPWPDPASPATVRVAAVWSETDWIEGDAPGNYINYNWTNPTEEYAATYLCAQDIQGGDTQVPWIFPGNAALSKPRQEDCTFLGTFLDGGDKRDLGTWQPWLNNVRSIANGATYQVSWQDQDWRSVPLDQAIVDDLYDNVNNRGLVVYNLPPDDFAKHGMFTKEQGNCPHIEATVLGVHPGDATVDGRVNYLDLGIMATNYGATGAAWTDGDFTGDTVVSYLDLGIMATHYGWTHPAAGAGGSGVPEPASALLLLVGSSLAALLRRRPR